MRTALVTILMTLMLPIPAAEASGASRRRECLNVLMPANPDLVDLIEAGVGEGMGLVACCESRLDRHAVSPTGDHGLLQANAKTWRRWWRSQGLDPYGVADGIAIGRHILRTQGIRAWRPSVECHGMRAR